MKPKKAVAYIRVSTNEQAKGDKFGLEVQRKEISEYALKNGFEIVEWFSDVMSGAKDNRPAWNTILLTSSVKNPPYEAVIVFKYDRVAREMLQLCYAVLELKRKGVALHSVHDDMDLEKPENKLMLAVVGYCAEKERENITLRTSHGRHIKAEKGGYSGGRPPYGYKTQAGLLVVNESEADVVRTIFRMRDNGISYNKIAIYLNDNGCVNRSGGVWTMDYVCKVAKLKKFYQGYYKYGKNAEWVKGQHEAIINE